MWTVEIGTIVVVAFIAAIFFLGRSMIARAEKTEELMKAEEKPVTPVIEDKPAPKQRTRKRAISTPVIDKPAAKKTVKKAQ